MFHRLLLPLCTLLLPLHAAPPGGTDLSGLNKGDKTERHYRERRFCAYQPLEQVSGALRIGRYSAFENPTGIYFRAGEDIRITLRDKPDGTARLIIHDFCEGGGEDRYALSAGENRLTVKRSGLGYIDYRSPQGCKAAPLDVRLSGGVVNGIFSRHDDAATWRRLLGRAPAGILDIVGERCQLAYSVGELRRGNPDHGPEMLALYDRIVELQQQLMGWDREDIHPGNHMFCRVIWNGYMHADGLGAAFHNSTIPGICNPEQLRRGAWGVAHELGHVNQVEPSFCWAGLTEVSNNVFSAWCNYQLNKDDMRLEHEVVPNADGRPMRGGRFDCYINNALVKRQLWQYQAGPDTGTDRVPGEATGDHFVTVCPLWQLLLYFHVALGKEDFYPTIFHELRQEAGAPVPHGQLRVNFCRYAGEAAQCDLGPFFLRTGMLALMNRMVEDYSPHMVSINDGMIEQALAELARHPAPASNVIHYITSNSVDIYREHRNLRPSPDFHPAIPERGGDIVFPADKWENAVAFEVYRGKKLLRVCLRGLGQRDNASTTVICPPGADCIRAVQWDGKRHKVTASTRRPSSR